MSFRGSGPDMDIPDWVPDLVRKQEDERPKPVDQGLVMVTRDEREVFRCPVCGGFMGSCECVEIPGAMGHRFGTHLNCLMQGCRRTWLQHREKPRKCPGKQLADYGELMRREYGGKIDRVVKLSQSGVSHRKIAKQLGLGSGVVGRICQHFAKEGE